jgi:bacillithiol system protein YtxJ
MIEPVIIFIHSNTCVISDDVEKTMAQAVNDKTIPYNIYIVTVQTHPNLSKKIEEHFEIKHESPQIIILNSGKVTYTAHHRDIHTDKFIFE